MAFQCIDSLKELGPAMGGSMSADMPGLDLSCHRLHPVMQGISLHPFRQCQGLLSVCFLCPELCRSF